MTASSSRFYKGHKNCFLTIISWRQAILWAQRSAPISYRALSHISYLNLFKLVWKSTILSQVTKKRHHFGSLFQCFDTDTTFLTPQKLWNSTKKRVRCCTGKSVNSTKKCIAPRSTARCWAAAGRRRRRGGGMCTAAAEWERFM